MSSAFLIIAIFLTSFTSAAFAQSWIPLGEKNDRLQIDLDSIRSKTESATFVEVTWRRTLNSDLVIAYTSLLNCDEFSITNLSKEAISPQTEQYSGRKRDKTDLFSSSAPEYDIDSRYEYPPWRAYQALLLKQACPRIQPKWEEKWLNPAPATDCQSLKSLFFKQLCAGNRDVLGDYNVMIYRAAQVEARCLIKREDSLKVFSFSFGKAELCRDDMCILNEMYSTLSGFEKDLKAAMKGEKCQFINKQLARMEMEQQNSKALADAGNYLRCAMIATPLLDDRISSAETVAIALHSKCKPILDAALAQSATLAARSGAIAMELRPKLIEFVLENRAMPIQNQAPPRSGNKQKPKSTI